MADMITFLEKIEDSTSDTVFAIDLHRKIPSTLSVNHVHTVTEADRIRTYGTRAQGVGLYPRVEEEEGTGMYIRTGAMLGVGRCYDRTE
jgi:hypothetical protein